MSAKQPNVEIQPSPRIPAREMMVTRRRSAQMKHQLRVKDRSMTKITQLLRSPTKASSKKSKSKTKKASKFKPKAQKVEKKDVLKMNSKKSQENSPKSIITMDNEEFCPHIKKRVYNKRTFLKVQNKLQMIGNIKSVSKRKTCLPRKGTTSPIVFCRATPERRISTPVSITKKFEPTIIESKSQSPVYAELSMQEVMRITEDTDMLTDEDFLEILTCPSPVWWEDPPGEAYIEEAICSLKPLNIEPVADKNMVVSKNVNIQLIDNISNTVSTTEADSFNKNTNSVKPPDTQTKRSDHWMRKRTKLENILGCVKNKIANSNNIPQPSDYLAVNNHSDHVVDNTKSNINSADTNPILRYEINDVAVRNSILNNTEVIHDIPKDTLANSKIVRNLNSCIKRVSESTDTDTSEFSINDEIIKNLENMFIPIAERSSSDRSESTNSDELDVVTPCDTSIKNELLLKKRSESNRRVASKGNDNISQTPVDTQRTNENRDIIDLEDLITPHKLEKKHSKKPRPKNRNDTVCNSECERVNKKKKKLKNPSVSKRVNHLQPLMCENACVNVKKYDMINEPSTSDMKEGMHSNSDTNVQFSYKNNEFDKGRVTVEQNMEKYCKSDDFFVNNDLVDKPSNDKDYCDLHIHSITKDTCVRDDNGKGNLKNCVTIHEILDKISKETSKAKALTPKVTNKFDTKIYDENIKIKDSETRLEILAEIESAAKVQASEIPNKVETVTYKENYKNTKLKNKRVTIQEILLKVSKDTGIDVRALADELANKIDTKHTSEDDKNKKINLFFKKSKHILKQQKKGYNQGKRDLEKIWKFKEESPNQRRIKDEPRTDADSAPSTSSVQNEQCETCSVAENNAIAIPGCVKSKYCFICSSIYDTQHCEYCRQLPTVWH